MTEEDRIRRASEANRIWNEPIFVEAREHIEKALMKGFADTPLRDDDGLRRIRMLYEAHKAYESFFRRAMDDGKMAEESLRHKKGLRDRIRQVI